MSNIESPQAKFLVPALSVLLALAGTSSALARQDANGEVTVAASSVGETGVGFASADLLRAGIDETQLKPGEFVWLPEAERNTGAPLTIIVNLRAQLAYVYRDGQPIAITTVSTGRPGRETPTGVYEILAKERMHHSNLYDDAPMPFMQRLSWEGVALHAGHITGRPSSHGCIRLPAKFAEQLYQRTQRGEVVVVSDDGSVQALARAGLDAQLGMLAGTAATIHAMVGAVGPAPALGSDTQAIAQDGDGADSFSR